MNTLIELFLSRTKTNISILIFAIFAGLLTYFSIPKESKPDVVIPIVHVSVIYEGISSDDAERLLIRPIEQEVRGLDGVKTIKSTAFEGGATIIIEFKAGLSIDEKIIDVRDRIDRSKPFLPSGTKDPIVSEINLSLFPILSIKLSGKTLPKRKLYQIAQQLKDDVEANISSVLKVNIVGNQEEVIKVVLEPSALNRLNIPFDEAIQMIRLNNQMISAGYTDTNSGRLNLKVSGIVKDVFDIMNLPILSDEVSTITLKDIASIEKSYKTADFIVFDRATNETSEPAVVLEVSKRTGENLIETVQNIKQYMNEQKEFLPKNLSITFANDESIRIYDMLNELQNNIILAIILVMGVIVLSLGWRPALLIGIAVPGSFLMGMLCLSFLDCTLNIVVLFSLIFSIGMLVDGAIIVVEYADRLMSDEKLPPYDAFIKASQRMAWPVITSISTILVVFLPLLFWPGVVGQFMKYMPITLLCVLTASILMALIFIPSIAMNLKLKVSDDNHQTKEFFLDKPYQKILHLVLNSPKKTILFAICSLIIVKGIHGFVGKGIEFFPNIEPDQVIFQIHGRGSLSLNEKKNLVKTAEKRILSMNELSSVVTYVGYSTQEDSKDIIGSIIVEFVDWKKRRTASKIIQDVLERMRDIPGIYVDFKKDAPGPSKGKPIQLELSSHYYEKIAPLAEKITAFMLQQENLISVENSLPLPSIEWKFHIDRPKMTQAGVNVATLGQAIRLLTIGAVMGTYRPDDAVDEIDISLELPKDKQYFDYLETITVSTKNGTQPITQFITFSPQQRTPQIDRVDGQKVIKIQADVSPNGFPLEEQQKIDAWIKKQNFPSDVKINFKGEDEDRNETSSFLLQAFGVALFLVWLILVTQFNSFYKAFLVLSAVVMSTIGVFIGLMIHNLPFGIVMGGIGIIALAGLIVSNNIILIDTFDHLMDDFKKTNKTLTLNMLKNIIVETCTQRLRPVFLTKLTAILGLLPILFRMEINFFKMEVHFGGPSTEWWILLSVCIVYGILFASSLTLLVTPCVLWLKEKKNITE